MMMEVCEDEDLALALHLQGHYMEIGDYDEVYASPQRGSPRKNIQRDASPLSIVDESWELIDPVPDIRELFVQFNAEYFEGTLAGVEVKWSPRMTLCAGLCCYEGRGGLCSIRLSQPLLKLRPRRDLVQTLLHEMIHALLFVTNNNKAPPIISLWFTSTYSPPLFYFVIAWFAYDHDSHGPEFHKHMNRINKLSGAHITVYHSFHDEVNEYRQHWWRCNGPCVRRPPFYGIVRRAMNRAPSSRDPWWADHQSKCGGQFAKIKEPEGYGRGPTKKGTSKPIKGTLPSGDKHFETASKQRGLITEWFKNNNSACVSSTGPSSQARKRRTDDDRESQLSNDNVVYAALDGNHVSRKNVHTLQDVAVSHSSSCDRGSQRTQALSGNSQNNKVVKAADKFPGAGHVLGSTQSGKGPLLQEQLVSFPASACSGLRQRGISETTCASHSNGIAVGVPRVDEASCKAVSSATILPRKFNGDVGEASGKDRVVSKGKSSNVIREGASKHFRASNINSTTLTASSNKMNVPEQRIMVRCPACARTLAEDEINTHLDSCLA